MTDSTTYLLATRSGGKLRELRPLFEQHGILIIDLRDAGIEESADEDAIEAYETFEENARAKAKHFHRLSGMPVFADDSGLAVEILGGQPGVRSKRWSGTEGLSEVIDAANNAKLLAELARVSASDPVTAEYVCAAAFSDGTSSLVTLGRTRGSIVRTPAGLDGFGYDPYFYSDDLQTTFGQATAAQKNQVSHRGRAFTALLRALAPSMATN